MDEKIMSVVQEYVSWKQCTMNEKYVDESVGTMVRMMARGGCLPVSGSTRMSWKYDGMHCVCGDVESEKHVCWIEIFTWMRVEI